MLRNFEDIDWLGALLIFLPIICLAAVILKLIGVLIISWAIIFIPLYIEALIITYLVVICILFIRSVEQSELEYLMEYSTYDE